MELYDWNQLPAERMNPLVVRKAVHTRHMTIARLYIRKGAVVPEHSHVNEQVSSVERGALKFFIDGGETMVHSGEVLVIPPHMPHKVEATEDTDVTDIFSPVREDWIRGDDAYLRR
jgi:quercetin dioxygenase-like cupin family protein